MILGGPFFLVLLSPFEKSFLNRGTRPSNTITTGKYQYVCNQPTQLGLFDVLRASAGDAGRSSVGSVSSCWSLADWGGASPKSATGLSEDGVTSAKGFDVTGFFSVKGSACANVAAGSNASSNATTNMQVKYFRVDGTFFVRQS